MLGAELLLGVLHLGGTVRPVGPFHHRMVEPREESWQRTVAAPAAAL